MTDELQTAIERLEAPRNLDYWCTSNPQMGLDIALVCNAARQAARYREALESLKRYNFPSKDIPGYISKVLKDAD